MVLMFYDSWLWFVSTITPLILATVSMSWWTIYNVDCIWLHHHCVSMPCVILSSLSTTGLCICTLLMMPQSLSSIWSCWPCLSPVNPFHIWITTYQDHDLVVKLFIPEPLLEWSCLHLRIPWTTQQKAVQIHCFGRMVGFLSENESRKIRTASIPLPAISQWFSTYQHLR